MGSTPTDVSNLDPDQVRAAARDVLDSGQFEPKAPPRPFKGLLDWLGDRIRPVGEWIADVWNGLFDAVPAPLAWLVVAAIVAAAIGSVALAVQRRGLRADVAARTAADTVSRDDDPAELERRAADAERRGDHDLGVRLRFRAGLVRLDRDASAFRYHAGLGTREVRRALRDERFDSLADTFDAVAYGNRDADDDDSRTARAEWPEVVRHARR